MAIRKTEQDNANEQEIRTLEKDLETRQENADEPEIEELERELQDR